MRVNCSNGHMFYMFSSSFSHVCFVVQSNVSVCFLTVISLSMSIESD